MSELNEKVRASIQRMKAFEPPEGYLLAFSGGKTASYSKPWRIWRGCLV